MSLQAELRDLRRRRQRRGEIRGAFMELRMSAARLQHLVPHASCACQAARAETTVALSEMARLQACLPRSRKDFTAQTQRIADEHAGRSGRELLIYCNADGIIELRLNDGESKSSCEGCEVIDCFFHPRPE